MRDLWSQVLAVLNPFTTDPGKALQFVIRVIFNFWHLGALALRNERQSTRMSKIKNGALDQHGTKAFTQQQFGTAGVEGVKRLKVLNSTQLNSSLISNFAAKVAE